MSSSRSPRRRRGALLAAAVLGACVVALAWPASRRALVASIPHDRVVQLNGLRFGYGVERELRLRMPDGVHLAASLYLPRRQDEIGRAHV